MPDIPAWLPLLLAVTTAVATLAFFGERQKVHDGQLRLKDAEIALKDATIEHLKNNTVVGTAQRVDALKTLLEDYTHENKQLTTRLRLLETASTKLGALVVNEGAPITHEAILTANTVTTLSGALVQDVEKQGTLLGDMQTIIISDDRRLGTIIIEDPGQLGKRE